MLVYRIAFKAYSDNLFAPGLSGRWNVLGRKVVYTAESIPLAFLENMVRRKGVGFNQDFKTMVIEVPDALTRTEIQIDSLAKGWRDLEDYSYCQQIGNQWYDKGETPVLKVLSAVLPDNYNYVLNATHPDFKKVVLLKTTDLIPDARIEELLKNYSK